MLGPRNLLFMYRIYQNISSCGLIIKKRWFKQTKIRNIDTKKKIIKYSGTLLGDF